MSHPFQGNRVLLEVVAEAQGVDVETLIYYRRLERRRRRASNRRRYATRLSLHQAIRSGFCAGVPEIGHASHTDVDRGDMTRDHIIPRCLGGTNGLENLRPICIDSHRVLNLFLDRHLKRGLGLVEWMRWQYQFDVTGDVWIK